MPRPGGEHRLRPGEEDVGPREAAGTDGIGGETDEGVHGGVDVDRPARTCPTGEAAVDERRAVTHRGVGVAAELAQQRPLEARAQGPHGRIGVAPQRPGPGERGGVPPAGPGVDGLRPPCQEVRTGHGRTRGLHGKQNSLRALSRNLHTKCHDISGHSVSVSCRRCDRDITRTPLPARHQRKVSSELINACSEYADHHDRDC